MLVVALWLIALVGFSAADQAAHASYSTKFQLPNTQSATALSLLQKDFPAASGDSDQIVLHAKSGTGQGPGLGGPGGGMLGQGAALPHVRSVISPYAAPGRAQISRDGTVAVATVGFDELTHFLTKAAVQRVI